MDQKTSDIINRVIVGGFFTLVLLMITWIYQLAGGIKTLEQYKEGHEDYHVLEEKGCIEFRKAIQEKIKDIKIDCTQLENRINDK